MRAPRLFFFSVSCVFVAGILSGCGGGGAGGGGAAGLSGVITTKDFIVPAGTTQTVTGDLTVNASHSIQINGTLAVTPGVALKLVSAGVFTVPGTIGASARSANTRMARNREAAVDPTFVNTGGDIDISGAVSLRDAINVAASGNINIPSPAKVTTSGGTGGGIVMTAGGAVIIGGTITADSGAPAPNATAAAGTGGGIEIGTSNAISIANANGVHLSSAPVTVDIHLGTLLAGSGGAGFSDTKGVLSGGTLKLTGGAAGPGGNITIVATGSGPTSGIIVSSVPASILAGAGGVGGNAGNVNVVGGTHAPDGAAPGAPGTAIDATSGAGGNGGIVLFTAPTITGTAGQGGAGGASGAFRLGAGNGAAGAAGVPGGAGGATSLHAGAIGAAGTGPTNGSIGPYHINITLENSGNGGAGPSIASGAGNNAVDAGFGGAMLLEFLIDVGNDDALLNQLTIDFVCDACAAGGSCSSNCPAAGGAGGNGGTLTLNNLGNVTITGDARSAGGSFSGGGGGGGSPAGTGGSAGSILLQSVTGTVTVNGTAVTSGAKIGATGSVGGGCSAGSSTIADLDLGATASGSGGGIALDSVDKSLFVTNGLANMVFAVDATTLQFIGSPITLTHPGSPTGLAYNPVNGTVYVASVAPNPTSAGTVYMINAGTRLITGSITVGALPEGVVVNPTLNLIYVANTGDGTVSCIDGGTNTVKATLHVGGSPEALALNSATGDVWVPFEHGNNGIVINNLTVTGTIPVGSIASLGAISADSANNIFYITDLIGVSQQEFYSVDGASRAVTAINIPGTLAGPVCVANAHNVLVGTTPNTLIDINPLLIPHTITNYTLKDQLLAYLVLAVPDYPLGATSIGTPSFLAGTLQLNASTNHLHFEVVRVTTVNP